MYHYSSLHPRAGATPISLKIKLLATILLAATLQADGSGKKPGPRGAPESGLTGAPPWAGSRLAGTGREALPYVAVPVFEGIDWQEPLALVRVPGPRAGGEAVERFLVLERRGALWSVPAEGGERDLFLQLTGMEEAPGGKPKPRNALGGIFHRDYPGQSFVFVSSNEKSGATGINRLSRFRVSMTEPPRADAASEQVILQWESNGHNGGDLKFGRDGFLYVSTGDGASPGDPGNVGQTVDNLLGSILRIDIDAGEAGKPYRVPADNPFVGMEGVRPEIWAYGLRNPWRMNFRPGTDELWLGDNGDEHWEMVHRVARGANFGWSAFEGSHPFRTTNKLSGPTLEHTVPAVEHPHQDMRSVIGGLWYRGDRFPELRGRYLYGCYFTRKMWGFSAEDDVLGAPARLADIGGQIVCFAEDDDREVLVVTLDEGIFRLEKAPDLPAPEPVPAWLSETGFFASTGDHRVAEGLLPYEINAPAYWDGAHRERFFAMPPGEKVQVQATPPGLSKIDRSILRTTVGLDRWKMPEGSVFVQTFSLGPDDDPKAWRRVETQISLKDDGEWRFLTYRWNDDQSDAELVPESGIDAVIEVPDKGVSGGVRRQPWRFMGRVECTACHTQRSMFVLGMNMAQLNRDGDYRALGGRKANQLSTFDHLGFFQRKYRQGLADEMPAMPNPHDESLPLEDRARAYLHVNCAHCHRETGLGGRAEFQLLHWLKTGDLGIVGARPLVGLPGVGVDESRLVVPGDPHRSEVYRRMATRDIGKMPLIGSFEIDEAGLDLIGRWIESLGNRP